MPDDDPANDNYKNLGDPLQETLNQLQILEHIENSPRGLSQEDRALKERLEKRERDLRAIDIKDVNETLESRRFTAELTLQSHARISGDALHLSDNPQRVVAELLKDVIHYCQTRSEGVPLDSPEHLDFDKLVKIARQELHAEMRPAPQISEQRTPEAQQLAPDSPGPGKNVNSAGKELLDGLRDAGQISRADTEKSREAAMPDENQFTAKVPFTQDPEFIKLQRNLQLRQEQEHKELEKQQTDQRIEFGRQPGVTRQQLDDNYKRQLQEREAQSKSHKAETDRHTRDYHDAKVLREEMRENEKRETLERGIDPDNPKMTR
jgi:hypothetical protein